MDKYTCSKLALQHFNNKTHVLEYEEFAGNKFEFRTYEVEVALFEEDFHIPPVIHSIRVRLKDEDYLLLLQWQLQNPDCGFNHYQVDADASVAIQNKVEDVFFPDGNIGTYAVFLKEIRQDAKEILLSLNENK
jgi:hypothetical protein